MSDPEKKILSICFPELPLELTTKQAVTLEEKNFSFFAAFSYRILCISNIYFFTSVLLAAVWDLVLDITKETSSTGNLGLLWFVQCSVFI